MSSSNTLNIFKQKEIVFNKKGQVRFRKRFFAKKTKKYYREVLDNS
jgi:hypothetical protein